MTHPPSDDVQSPLDEILDNLPQETPPTDLQDRCLTAVHTEAARLAQTERPRPWGYLGVLASVAAAFMLVCLMTLTPNIGCPKKAEPPPPAMGGDMGMPGPGGPPTGPFTSPGKGAPPPPMGSEDHAGYKSAGKSPMAQAPPSPGGPGGAPGMPGGGPSPSSMGGPGGPGGPSRSHDAAKSAPARPMSEPAPKLPAPGSAGMPAPGAPPAMTPPPPPPPNTGGRAVEYGENAPRPYPEPGDSAAPARPWRDRSGERQKVITKQMAMDVPKVLDALDRIKSILDRAEGFTLSEDFQTIEGGKSQAHVTARVPVDRIDGVVAQIRELGKVTRLVGQSEDRTKDYYGRGEDIRETGAGEDELVAKYEAAKDPAEKRRLYNQIQELRANNKASKGGLQALSEQTHFALLDLTLTQQSGPGDFLARMGHNSALLAGWLAATAIIWLPLLIIAWLLWRRKAPGPTA
jgi:hypothetical protein